MVTSRNANTRKRAPRKKETSTCQDRLRNDAKIIKILERIDGRRAKSITDAGQVLQHPQTARDAQVYVQFLKDIIRHASPGHAALCAASLGKQRVSRLKEYERADVVQFVKENKEGLSCEALTSLAEECGIRSFTIDSATLYEPDEQLSNVLHGQGEVPIRSEGESSEQNTNQPVHAIRLILE
jgi:hypothetical protein